MPAALSNAGALAREAASPVMPSPARPERVGTVPEASSGADGDDDDRERFIPITLLALLDRLTVAAAWPAGMAIQARRFFRYLDHWRQQQYSARLLRFEQSYEPFSPDSDLLITRTYTEEE